MSVLLQQARPKQKNTLRFLRESGKPALEVGISVGVVYLNDPEGPSVVTRLNVPKRVRSVLSGPVYDAVHAGVVEANVAYPPGGLGVWVVLTSKGQLVRYADLVSGHLAHAVRTSVGHFLLNAKPPGC